MKSLIPGIHQFHEQTFQQHKDLFQELAKGQHPQALFITCSDSRIVPTLLTSTKPGDLFIVRNIGNIVPASGQVSSEHGAIEYALEVLDIKDIIICGHLGCGAIKALIEGADASLLAVTAWLKHAAEVKQIVEKNYPDADLEQRCNIAVQENVLVQVEHLLKLPFIASRVAEGKLQLHAWVYKLQTGEVFSYDAGTQQFLPVSDVEQTGTDTSCSHQLQSL